MLLPALPLFFVAAALPLLSGPEAAVRADAAAVANPGPSAASTGAPGLPECPDPPGGHAAAGIPAPDLHCIVLFPTREAATARGRVLLEPASTPFGVAVDRDGRHRQRLVVEVEGLPDPSELGEYDRYVAWVTTPSLAPVLPLGRVRNGRQEVGEAAFNTFLVLISAEGPDVGDERRGPLVLRGSSPAMVLRPHDLPYILAEMSARWREGEDPHAAHRHHPPDDPPDHDPAAPVRVHVGHGFPAARLPAGAGVPWRVPPMHPEVGMPASMMLLRPQVRAFHPIAAEDPEDGDDRLRRPAAAAAIALPPARPREEVWLAPGDSLTLEAGPVLRRVGDLAIPGYGFNGQIPGPLIRAAQGSTVHVRFRNRTALPSAVHWHGIRLENPFDGVPGVTQDPVPPGEDFDYRILLPDEGTYWYHPHLREDVTQDLGLSGNIRVLPAEGGDPYGPVHADEVLLLDDHLVGPDGPVPYGREAPIHALMGRFGNRLLVNGESRWSTRARPGSVVRFHLTNAANTRTFNVSFGDLPAKVVAGDVGKLPREVWVESVVIAPAERWVVEVRFPEAGDVPLVNRVQALDHMGARFFAQVDTLGTIRVEGDPVEDAAGAEDDFRVLRDAPGVLAEVRDRGPERTLVLGLRTRDLPFPLDPLLWFEGVFRPAVEWEGTMPDMDWLVSGEQVEWLLRDPDTGAENMEIDWRFRVGDRVRLRLVNDRATLHPMQHPIHVHGQRFLVLAVNGREHPHPAWKDTVLVPVGAVVDIVVEMSNPGDWMIHCHIAEHLETGMMAVFRVDP